MIHFEKSSFISFATLAIIVLVCNAQVNYDYFDHGDDWTKDVYCHTGTRQSPVDLITFENKTNSTDNHYFLTLYKPSQVTAHFDNVTAYLQVVNFTAGIGKFYAIIPDGKGTRGIFSGYSIRFHSPSEHTYNGNRYPIEVQIYHSLQLKPKYTVNQGVISLFFDNKTGANPSPLLQQVIDNKNKNISSYSIDLTEYLDISKSNNFNYYGYQGSFTYPGCYEINNWYLIDQVFDASSEQVQFFWDLYHNNPKFNGTGNYRNTQKISTKAQNVTLYYFTGNP